MEPSQFEKLEEKVTMALKVIKDLKAQKQSLIDELNESKEKVSELESKTLQQDEDLARLKSDFSQKTDNMAKAGGRIQDLISKLDEENLETLLEKETLTGGD
jgi:FtsZ-binding cell division protein ZapB